MLKKLRDIESLWSLFGFLVGSSLVGTVITYFTDALKIYSPLSYFIVIMFVLAFSSIIYGQFFYKRKLGKEKIRGLKKIIGKHYKNESVCLDGIEFINCKFDDCTLEYGGGNFEIFGNKIAQTCQMRFLTIETANSALLVSIFYEFGKKIKFTDSYGRHMQLAEVINESKKST